MTRSRAGARLLLWGLALGPLLLAPKAARALDPNLPGELPWRVGGRVGFTVDAAAYPDSGSGHVLQVYVRIPPTTLESLTRDEQGGGEMRLSANLKGAYGGGRTRWSQEFSVPAHPRLEGLGKVVMMSFAVRPGPHRLEVKLEDRLSRKRGLIYMGRQVNESAEVEGDMVVPEPQQERDISNIGFVWADTAATGPAAFTWGGRLVLPNAERLFGLFEPRLRARFATRGRPNDTRAWFWVARLFDAEGRELVRTDSAGTAGHRFEAMLEMDLRGLPAGGYDLEVKAWQEGDEGALLARSRFSIAWKERSWLSSAHDVEDIVHFLLDAEAEERFVLLQPGEQERYMDDFWRRRDPDPETDYNEAREAYLARVAYANANYTWFGVSKGMFSDRGRVYIRYGEPTEILQQVIPAGDETLRQMIMSMASTEDRSPENVLQPSPGGDMRPFEVWIYTGNIPLPPDADPDIPDSMRRHRLVFLFVDEQGLGHYTLRYSTE